ncbi:hypothetical protein D9M72_177450 [compost metagenome]
MLKGQNAQCFPSAIGEGLMLKLSWKTPSCPIHSVICMRMLEVDVSSFSAPISIEPLSSFATSQDRSPLLAGHALVCQTSWCGL